MSTAVSAPAKVLLAGGYLVLDRAYTALVFGLRARIHVLVEDIDPSSGVQLSDIVVQSPQFRDATWNYGYHLTAEKGGVEVTQLQGASSLALSKNPFVETALSYALTYISAILPNHHIKPSSVTILADNDYYSQPTSSAPPREESSSKEKSFTNFHVRLQEAHKTGLGSSAALVTAFTGALLTHYLPRALFTLSTPSGRRRLHNLAQAAHCAAQGKVGSGFDVATAVYGTCIYRRFSPSILDGLGEASTPGFGERVRALVEDAGQVWDVEIRKEGVTIPHGMALVMCDVNCGSETVGMVKNVLSWRKSDVEGARDLWDDLQAANMRLGKLLAGQGTTEEEFVGAFGEVRKRIREMGGRSGVPIEPPEQTELLDALTGLDGVAGGVVPGAGGYDAVVLLVKDDEVTMGGITTFLEKWSREKGSNVKLLGTKGELEGAREEDGGSYGAWVN